jgi:transposase
MLRMEQVHVIRHKHYVEGQGIRGIAREMGLHRKTVRKYLERPEPARHESGARRKRVMDAVGPRIDEILEDWKSRTTRKQRVTSSRMHRRLLEEGYRVGERTVRAFLAERRRAKAEVYVPLVHHPGDSAQVDFFEVTVEEDGSVRTAWKFLARLMYSGRDFIHIYDRCDQISFLDGHARAFGYFGGVPRRMVYDNLTAAVKRRCGLSRERELTDAFRALASHYLFEACFARPGEGHDKGGVESRGKGIRLQHMTPVPRGPDLAHISSSVMAGIEEAGAAKIRRDGMTSAALFDAEKTALNPLPAVPYEARAARPLSVSRSSTVTVGGALYSLPERWARLEATAYVGAGDIRFVCRGEAVVRKRAARGGRVIVYRDYLRELSGKPQAVRQVAAELVVELGHPYKEMWSLLERTHGPLKGARVLAGVLGAIHDHGEEAVTRALSLALSQGRTDLLGIRGQIPAESHIDETLIPLRLRHVRVEAGRAADYDTLMRGGAR